MPCHENEDLPHYHLIVMEEGGCAKYEIPVLFRDDNSERNIESATICDIKAHISNILGLDGMCLLWKGCVLEPDTLLVRDVCVDGEFLPLYVPNISEPIIVVKNKCVMYNYGFCYIFWNHGFLCYPYLFDFSCDFLLHNGEEFKRCRQWIYCR